MFFGQTRFSLVSAMTSMLALGLTIEQIVPMVTTHPAKMLGMENEIGSLETGREADISVLHDERGSWTLQDNEKTKLRTDRMLRPYFCLRAGKRLRFRRLDIAAAGRSCVTREKDGARAHGCRRESSPQGRPAIP